MTTDTGQTDPRDIWQADSSEPFRLSPAELEARIERLGRTTRRRNHGGLIVSGIVLAGCVWWLVKIDDPLARAGALLTVAGVSVLAFQLRANQGEGAAFGRGALMGGTPSVAFHRGELTRQRDFHRGRRLWARLLALLPGPLLFFAGLARAHPEVAGIIRLEALAFVLLLLAAVPLNLRMARGYQRQLDELDRLQDERP